MDMSVDESVCSSKDTPTRCKDNRKTLLYAAQRGMYEKRMKSPRAFSVLPTYGQTPPGCKIYNPFKTDVDLLEGHTCSPTIFTKTVSSESGEFTWSIDDISRINPAPINSPIELPEEKLEDHMEEKAQAAIERYFSLRHDIVSPISGPGQWISPAASATPASSSTPCHGRSQRVQDVSTQTVLSFPAVLPPELETILKQYNIKIEEETDTIEDCNLSNSNNSSLRRKLFFNKEEFISPVKKLCYDGSPTSNSYTKPSRIDWTLEQKTEILSSPDISPIKFKPEPMCISGIFFFIIQPSYLCFALGGLLFQKKAEKMNPPNGSLFEQSSCGCSIPPAVVLEEAGLDEGSLGTHFTLPLRPLRMGSS